MSGNIASSRFYVMDYSGSDLSSQMILSFNKSLEMLDNLLIENSKPVWNISKLHNDREASEYFEANQNMLPNGFLSEVNRKCVSPIDKKKCSFESRQAYVPNDNACFNVTENAYNGLSEAKCKEKCLRTKDKGYGAYMQHNAIPCEAESLYRDDELGNLAFLVESKYRKLQEESHLFISPETEGPHVSQCIYKSKMGKEMGNEECTDASEIPRIHTRTNYSTEGQGWLYSGNYETRSGSWDTRCRLYNRKECKTSHPNSPYTSPQQRRERNSQEDYDLRGQHRCRDCGFPLSMTSEDEKIDSYAPDRVIYKGSGSNGVPPWSDDRNDRKLNSNRCRVWREYDERREVCGCDNTAVDTNYGDRAYGRGRNCEKELDVDATILMGGEREKALYGWGKTMRNYDREDMNGREGKREKEGSCNWSEDKEYWGGRGKKLFFKPRKLTYGAAVSRIPREHVYCGGRDRWKDMDCWNTQFLPETRNSFRAENFNGQDSANQPFPSLKPILSEEDSKNFRRRLENAQLRHVAALCCQRGRSASKFLGFALT